MGQRLNIEIVEGEKILANSYYHWNAYTSTSIELTKTIIEKFNQLNNENNLQKAVLLLQETGAGFSQEELEQAKSVDELSGIELKQTTGRNNGLLSITEKGMEDTRYWEEGRVTVDISSKTINFNVYCEVTEDERLENYHEKEITELNVDIENIPFDDFSAFAELFNKIDSLFKADGFDNYLSQKNNPPKGTNNKTQCKEKLERTFRIPR